MPKNISISKDSILNTALEIVREKGIDAVSNREIAKKLNMGVGEVRLVINLYKGGKQQ